MHQLIIRMKFLLNCLLFVFALATQAQDTRWNLFPGTDTTKTQASNGEKIQNFNLNFDQKPGTVTVKQDARTEKLIGFIGEPQKGATVTMKGFRVQLFFDTNKDQVSQKRADYLARHDEHPAYVDYLQPNFRLRVGNFRTRLQAQKWQDEMKIDFPDAIIVEEWIELPSLKISEGK